MLDELLGRAELKARIEELEEEKGHLEARLEAESDRRADAVSDRQAAEERVNRLEDRIAELEGKIERLDGDTDGEREFRGRDRLRGHRLGEVRSRLASFETEPEGALTAMVSESLPTDVTEAFGDRAPLVRQAAPCLALTDDAGLVAVVLDVPCPPEPFVSWGAGFDVDPAWVGPVDGDVFALVRSDLFAVGRFEAVADDDAGGDADGNRDGAWRFLDGFESDVKSAHSKGGFSQGRFERRRDAQIDDHTERCLERLDDLDPGSGRRIVVGEKTVLGAFADADYRARVDATGDPEPAFEEAVSEFFTARLSLVWVTSVTPGPRPREGAVL